ncbi:putative deoxyribonuclease tatdn3 [Geranomyces variabilis]|uniref:Deoxyribonuclease tatdn3 n=1 Tax=Geranomyces variabilis TaxID=109894 RepID=A0AAD5XU87_9FUNG|nr:putative deoxyribonuclease tatdn3 [Geranomyces variabilis]
MALIDCHAHLQPAHFPSLQDTIADARAAGVTAILNVSESLTDCAQVLALASAHPILRPCIGLHPVQPATGKSVTLADLPAVLELISDNAERIVAVGEVGLDFSPHVLAAALGARDEQKAVQREVFVAQARLAASLGHPVNVHSRQAGHYAIAAMVEAGVGGLLHAFDGKAAHAMKGVQSGFFFSVAPNIVRSVHLRKLVKAIPLDYLVLETDSPALGPVSGVTNVPMNVRIACQEVANIKGITVEEAAEITTANAIRCFPRLARRE